MRFNVYGHENLLGTHRNTFEFTKESHLTKKGDCIIGVDSDFDPEKLKQFVKENRAFRIIFSVDGLTETAVADMNKDFDDSEEIVIRKTDFFSKRTLGIRADKAACDFDRKIIELLKVPGKKATVELEGIKR